MLLRNYVAEIGLIFYIVIITNILTAGFESFMIEEFLYKNIFDDDNAVNNQSEQNFIVVPLGCHCGVAWWMREFNIRTTAFPFDWCITPYQALYEIIDNNFQDYFKRENLVPSGPDYWGSNLYEFYNRVYHSEVDGSAGAVLDKKFQMIFSHDFPNKLADTINQYYNSQYEKYSRRVKRLFEATNSQKHIYFIRLHDITKTQTLELYKLLKSKFPKSSFTLIALGSDSKEFSENWKIHNIKNIFISEDTVNLFSLGTPFWEKFTQDLISGKFK